MEYKIYLGICLLFAIMAFIYDTPLDILSGMGRILSQRGLLITDYIVVGGFGAAIVNSTLVSLYAVAVLYFMKAKPSGTAIMCLWMSTGWTYWGANVLNILPLTCGVWLYSRYKKAPFADYVVAALLCHTIAPIVSVFYISNPIMLHLGSEWPLAVNILCGIFAGLFCGFFLPVILSAMPRVHNGFTLYNMGVAGGIMAVFVAAFFKGAGIPVPTESMWYTGRQFELAVFLYVISTVLILTGLILNRTKKVNQLESIKKMIAHSGHAPNDFLSLCGDTIYINMGLLGAIGTTWALVFGLDLNAGTFACIFSMVAFGCLGKHVKNVLPLLAGATICALTNALDFRAPANALAILFSTCLAPIAGKYGIISGMIAGFLHVLIVIHVGPVTNGFNLYNNGFCSGFVALVLVPIIVAMKKKSSTEPE